MTPQEIMDLPYCGMAEKQLRKQRDWRFSPNEELHMIIELAQYAVDQASSSISGAEEHLETLMDALEGKG